MDNMETLRQKLLSLDGKGYGAYKSIRGSYAGGWFQLFIDHVQADPFAPPSRGRVRVEHGVGGFPPDLYKNSNLSVNAARVIDVSPKSEREQQQSQKGFKNGYTKEP